MEPSPREYEAGGTYFPRSYSYTTPAPEEPFANRQTLGGVEPSQQAKRHRRTQSLDPRLSARSGDSSTSRISRLSYHGRAGSLQAAVKQRISLALYRGSQARLSLVISPYATLGSRHPEYSRTVFLLSPAVERAQRSRSCVWHTIPKFRVSVHAPFL